ncbi:MAG: prephenate dehydrogenase/arogenate dehydrogenase family protein, partial [Alphaproteobacteria bacterium]|nr:prephenate dehydrogenase/arogenate dehydrogenase family protein [Alphaproteobacteria bacterium]
MTQLYDKIALIGLGLIAGSIGFAVKRGGLAAQVVGHARTAETRAAALELGFCDAVFDTAAEAVKDADLVILCVPVGVMAEVAAEIAPNLKPGATVSDVGSVKQAVVDAVAPHIPKGIDFVPAHPLAGTEHSGPHAGFAELFDNRWCILTPLPDGSEEAAKRLEALW